MPSVADVLGTMPTDLASALGAGIQNISRNATLTFTQYDEAILPIDGFRFWVRHYNADQSLNTIVAQGSFHYSSDNQQEETETYTINRVVFTTQTEITNFNAIDRKIQWIGEIDGILFAFNSRGSYYRQANVYHYTGQAIWADMATQVIKSAGDLDTSRVIVSNSLPLWLALNTFDPPNPAIGFPCPTTLYPSYLAPSNLTPPFASVNIQDETTEGLMSAPLWSANWNTDQLCQETVKITMYGLRNDEAITLRDCVIRYAVNFGTFGVMNTPVVRDEKRAQSDFSILGQKKSIQFVLNYYQSTARSIARQLLTDAQVSYLTKPF